MEKSIEMKLKNPIKHFLLDTGIRTLEVLGIFGGGLIGYAIGRLFGWKYLIYSGVYITVLYFTYSYFKNRNINIFLASVFAWSNILAWFLPPLGIFTAVATLGIARNVEQEGKKRYKTLAVIGIVLSIINMAFGAYQGFMKPV